MSAQNYAGAAQVHEELDRVRVECDRHGAREYAGAQRGCGKARGESRIGDDEGVDGRPFAQFGGDIEEKIGLVVRVALEVAFQLAGLLMRAQCL